ncbi:MAG: HAD-IIA family hydrolase [Mycobacteriales bacterium]|nr:HAD-IIA family hydrolase [Frankia sp.]
MTSALSGSATPLAQAYDAALIDLDGVVYRGSDAVLGAREALLRVRQTDMRVVFVTNNSSRTPDVIADHLAELGVPTTATDIVTAADAAAALLADHVPPPADVLVVGAAGLRTALAARGYRSVSLARDKPAAVAQGYTADVTYAELTEAALAVRAGAVWVASNADATLPSDRGLLPGNGALVAFVATATDRAPLVAGKPEPTLVVEARRRAGATRPLVVGDRADTDVAAAHEAGFDSLLVLTGVSAPTDLPALPPAHRPTYLGTGLDALLESQPVTRVAGTTAQCGDASVAVDGRALLVSLPPSGGTGGALDALRACCALVWSGAADAIPSGEVQRTVAALGVAGDR